MDNQYMILLLSGVLHYLHFLTSSVRLRSMQSHHLVAPVYSHARWIPVIYKKRSNKCEWLFYSIFCQVITSHNFTILISGYLRSLVMGLSETDGKTRVHPLAYHHFPVFLTAIIGGLCPMFEHTQKSNISVYIQIYSNSPQKYNSNFPLFKSHQIDVPYFSIYLFACTYPIIPCISHDLPTAIGMACPCPPPQWVAAFQTRCGTSLGRREEIMGISWGEWWHKGDIRRIKGDNDGKLIRDNTWI